MTQIKDWSNGESGTTEYEQEKSAISSLLKEHDYALDMWPKHNLSTLFFLCFIYCLCLSDVLSQSIYVFLSTSMSNIYVGVNAVKYWRKIVKLYR